MNFFLFFYGRKVDIEYFLQFFKFLKISQCHFFFFFNWAWDTLLGYWKKRSVKMVKNHTFKHSSNCLYSWSWIRLKQNIGIFLLLIWNVVYSLWYNMLHNSVHEKVSPKYLFSFNNYIIQSFIKIGYKQK